MEDNNTLQGEVTLSNIDIDNKKCGAFPVPDFLNGITNSNYLKNNGNTHLKISLQGSPNTGIAIVYGANSSNPLSPIRDMSYSTDSDGVRHILHTLSYVNSEIMFQLNYVSQEWDGAVKKEDERTINLKYEFCKTPNLGAMES